MTFKTIIGLFLLALTLLWVDEQFLGHYRRRLFNDLLWWFGHDIAIKIGAPAIAALLFTKVAFGLITKLIPQMNIMIVAFPVQIVVGLIFFGISLSVLLGSVEKYLGGLGPVLTNIMSWLKV